MGCLEVRRIIEMANFTMRVSTCEQRALRSAAAAQILGRRSCLPKRMTDDDLPRHRVSEPHGSAELGSVRAGTCRPLEIRCISAHI